MKLEGQVAVVTGAGRGIGRAIAEEQAKAGAKVALLSRSPKEVEAVAAEIVAGGGIAKAFATDQGPCRAADLPSQRIERRRG